MDVKENLKKISETAKRMQALDSFCEALSSGNPTVVHIEGNTSISEIVLNPAKTPKDAEHGDALAATFARMLRDEEIVLQNLVRPR